MFKKMVAVEDVRLKDETIEKLHKYTKELIQYKDRPMNNEELIKRIGDADAVLVSHTTAIDGDVLRACKNIKYVGMCCSLYAPESANVDILTAQELGICVKGVRDYGDEGVPEYVISELVRFFHGFWGRMWKEVPTEIKGMKMGVLGMGTTGTYIGRALKFFGAEVYYYSRTRKPELEQSEGFIYTSLDEMLNTVEVLATCLTKNIILLNQRELDIFSGNKIIINTSIGPAHDVDVIEKWLDQGNYLFGDTARAIDLNPESSLLKHSNVITPNQSAGMTWQTYIRLGNKVIENIENYFKENK